jgi:hypothetical protein
MPSISIVTIKTSCDRPAVYCSNCFWIILIFSSPKS